MGWHLLTALVFPRVAQRTGKRSAYFHRSLRTKNDPDGDNDSTFSFFSFLKSFCFNVSGKRTDQVLYLPKKYTIGRYGQTNIFRAEEIPYGAQYV